VLLSKTQKKRRKAKAKGKEINKGINVRVGYPDGYIKDNEKTIPPLGLPFTYEGLNFSDDPFIDKQSKPKCFVKCDDEIFKLIEPIIQQQFGQL